jgi:MarR family transcriptional regulator, organic hydroperoxide resistance regulator
MPYNLIDNAAFLIFRIGSKISADANQAFKNAGVSTMHARVLLALLSAETWTVGDLCQFTGIDQSTMSHSLAALARRGLVSKRRQASDNRTVRVRLTAKGLEMAHRSAEVAAQFDRALCNALGARQASALKALLRDLYEGMNGQAVAAE